MSPVEIRAATVHDLPAVLGLYRQLAEDREESLPAHDGAAERIFDTVDRDSNRCLLVADAGDRVLGTVDLVIIPNLTHRGMPWAMVENLAVDAAARRQGVGTELMREVERRALDAGCYKIQLLSRKTRTEAHAFYEAIGFEPAAEGFRRYFDRD